MTRYQKHMQHIHNQGTANAIEAAVMCITEDIADYLIKCGVHADSKLIKEVRTFKDYVYNPNTKRKTKIDGLQDSNTKP